MRIIAFYLFGSLFTLTGLCSEQTLFSGTDFNAFELSPGSWELESDGSMVCRMEKIKDKKGVERIRGMGYIWTKAKFDDFKLELEYKLSEGANSGIFYRTNKNDPVQGGFEIQLMDNTGFQKKAKKILLLANLTALFMTELLLMEIIQNRWVNGTKPNLSVMDPLFPLTSMEKTHFESISTIGRRRAKIPMVPPTSSKPH